MKIRSILLLGAFMSTSLGLMSAAKAASIVYEQVDINFAGGYNLSGTLDFMERSQYPQSGGYYLDSGGQFKLEDGNGNILQQMAAGMGGAYEAPIDYAAADTGYQLELSYTNINDGTIPTQVAQFTLNRVAAVSGEVCTVSGACSTLALPLPASLQLFVSGFAALFGFSFLRKRPRKLDV